MEKVTHWFFEIEHKNGRREICGYGNSEKYTQTEATERVKKLCECRGYKFIGIYKER